MRNPTKVFSLSQMKFDDATGTVTAMFAKFNDVDKQGDLTLPGAFGNQPIIIAAYGHGSWGSGLDALPVGKGRIYDGQEGGIMEGKFFLDTTAGLETYKTVKNVGELQEWSYSLPDVDFETRQENGERIRVLKQITVNEVSPVLMGAGNGTRTLDIKSGKEKMLDAVEAVLSDVRGIAERLRDVAALRDAKGSHPGAETIRRSKELRAQLLELSLVMEKVFERHDEATKEHIRFVKLMSERRTSCPVQS